MYLFICYLQKPVCGPLPIVSEFRVLEKCLSEVGAKIKINEQSKQLIKDLEERKAASQRVKEYAKFYIEAYEARRGLKKVEVETQNETCKISKPDSLDVSPITSAEKIELEKYAFDLGKISEILNKSKLVTNYTKGNTIGSGNSLTGKDLDKISEISNNSKSVTNNTTENTISSGNNLTDLDKIEMLNNSKSVINNTGVSTMNSGNNLTGNYESCAENIVPETMPSVPGKNNDSVLRKLVDCEQIKRPISNGSEPTQSKSNNSTTEQSIEQSKSSQSSVNNVKMTPMSRILSQIKSRMNNQKCRTKIKSNTKHVTFGPDSTIVIPNSYSSEEEEDSYEEEEDSYETALSNSTNNVPPITDNSFCSPVPNSTRKKTDPCLDEDEGSSSGWED